VLRNKKTSQFAPAFARHQPIAPANRSRFNTRADTVLGLGYVDAVLAVLHGLIRALSYDCAGARGRVSVSGSGGGPAYALTWDTTGACVYGGFSHSSGRPAYQAAIVGLCELACRARHPGTADTQVFEVMTRWRTLLTALDAAFPRRGTNAWDVPVLVRALDDVRTRPHIEQVCDALAMAMRCWLPSLTERDLTVCADAVLGLGDGVATVLLADALISPTFDPAPAGAPHAVAASAPTVVPAALSDGTRLAQLIGMAGEERIAQVHRAMARRLPLLLSGATGVGKTEMVLRLAVRAFSWEVEYIRLTPSWTEEYLFGSRVQDADGTWVFTEGPITRWARRVVEGDTVLLLVDELARGHRDVGELVLSLLSAASAEQVRAEGWPLPEDPDPADRYYIIRVKEIQAVYVLPASQAPIVCVTNAGERYTQSLNVREPALARRFAGGYLHIAKYDAAVEREILGAALARQDGRYGRDHPLVAAIVACDIAIDAYHAASDALQHTLDLATLLAWAEAARQLAASGLSDRQALLTAAQDLWLDRVCPLQGERIDPDVRRALLDILDRAAPKP
jgi:MoxR-like ATPase